MIYPLPINMDFYTWLSQVKNVARNLNIPNPRSNEQWWQSVDELKALNPNGNIPNADRNLYRTVDSYKIWAVNFLNNLNNE